jgi:hypothetical protein
VTSTAYDGEAVVEITNTEFPGNYAETLDLDASTGVLVHMRGGPVDGPAGVEVTYQISRVTIPSLTPAG